jgi:hypothetical protein
MMQTPLKSQRLPKDDGLVQAIERLERAAAADAPGRERAWADNVDGALAGLEAILQRHTGEAEAPDGLFAEVDLTRPTLARRVGALRREHTTLRQRTSSLRERVRRVGRAFRPAAESAGAPALPEPRDEEPVPDFGALRGDAERLLAALNHHREGETDLVFESVSTDIGVGD